MTQGFCSGVSAAGQPADPVSPASLLEFVSVIELASLAPPWTLLSSAFAS
jgi:hypothetical protein